MVTSFSKDEMDEFLENVDSTHKKVKDILDGKIDFDEFDKREAEEKKMTQLKKEVQVKEKQEKLLRGRKGKGHQKGYVKFCKTCFIEWMIDVKYCTQCEKETMTYQQRYEELKEKLTVYQEKKNRKANRLAKWQNWQKTQAMFYNKLSTNYNKWDQFESDEESEEEKEPIVPKDDPQFQAMEQDFKDRAARKKKEKKESKELKEAGNASMKRGLYKTANKQYSEAIEIQRDNMPCYTNRALALLKIEDFQGAIDDCARVLEYEEVFHDGFTRERDLCYKAFLRRAMAFRGTKDYQLALKDLEQAKILYPERGDYEKYKKLTEDDIELQARVGKIMENADALKGKEYIDFLLDLLQGKQDDPDFKKRQENLRRKTLFCFHELDEAAAQKLNECLVDNDVIFYFNAQNGMKSMVDSLKFNTNALAIIEKVLAGNEKLTEDFQKQHLFESLIDFLCENNKNAQEKTLDNAIVYRTLGLLESGSMNENVRASLSEKKKIKDLFLIVIKSIDISENRLMVSSLIQFISNLCFGQGRFRKFLASENHKDFFDMLATVYKSVMEQKDPTEAQKKEEADKSLLKITLSGFLANLCSEASLRRDIAGDMGGILQLIVLQSKKDFQRKYFDWVDQLVAQVALFVNVSIESLGQKLLHENDIIKYSEDILMACSSKVENQRVIVSRVFNMLSKLQKYNPCNVQIIQNKNIVLKTLLHFNKDYEVDGIELNCLRIFHGCCMGGPAFKQICLEQNKFTLKSFDSYAKRIKEMFYEAEKKEDWPMFINICGSINKFVFVFEERMEDFQDVIIPLISVVKDKTDPQRVNAARLLATLAKNESNSMHMRANHGHEILVSLRDVLTK